MLRSVLPLLLLASVAAAADEPYRPRFHFTPAKNWMNDPNGLVFFDGEYHLFYQYNPEGDKWGHMSWGHAVSTDLLTWEHLPLALAENKDSMIFSGSAVVDHANTSGFGKDGKPPLVAIYTAHHTDKPLQTQHLAYSTDRGRTWTKYNKNPVLDIGAKDFRDPKVIWHQGSKRWVMAVAWPDKKQVRFYASPDLKGWTHLSDFGPAGSTEGIWECPDLFPLELGGKTRWVLIVNVGGGAPAGGSGGQYFVGDFDGTTFTLDEKHPKDALWLDRGPDCYAAVTFSDVKDRRIAIGWMSNWLYANDVPTSPWRNAMTIPRELSLADTKAGPRLVSAPVKEVETLRGGKAAATGKTAAELTAWAKKEGLTSGPMELAVEFAAATKGNAGVQLFVGEKEETVVSVDRDKGLVVIDRGKSGNTKFSDKFQHFASAPLPDPKAAVNLRILVDACSVEVFVDGGRDVLTALTFPSEKSTGLGFFASDGKIAGVEVWPHKGGQGTAALPRATPESQGVRSEAIRAFVEAADAKVNTMHSVMVVRHGKVVAEGWWKPQAADTAHVLWSLSKSFTSTAVGLAIDEGKLSLDDEVLKFFPDDAPAEPSANLKAMRVRDLLCMSTGHETEPRLTNDTPWVKAFLAHPVKFKPGTHFQYNTPATYMCSAVVQKATGKTVLDYLQPKLFDPLGIPKPRWDASPQGVTVGGYGLFLNTEGIAKFGQLYLQKGKWGGEQVIPAKWVEAATARQTSNGSNPKSDWDQGYGYQFWRCRHGSYRGDGKDGQFCVVLPDQDAVVAITADTANMQAVLDLVWDKLLPGFKPDPLADNPAEQEKLKAALGNLTAKEKK